MDHLTPEQRVEVIKTFYLNNCSNVNTRRKLVTFFGANRVPSKSTIQRIIFNFEKLHTLGDKAKSGRAISQRTPEKVEAVRQSVAECPYISHRRRAQALGMSPSCMLKILKQDLQLHQDKMQAGLESEEEMPVECSAPAPAGNGSVMKKRKSFNETEHGDDDVKQAKPSKKGKASGKTKKGTGCPKTSGDGVPLVTLDSE